MRKKIACLSVLFFLAASFTFAQTTFANTPINIPCANDGGCASPLTCLKLNTTDAQGICGQWTSKYCTTANMNACPSKNCIRIVETMTDGFCAKGWALDGCLADTDCYFGECKENICATFKGISGNACRADNDCIAGITCISGKCSAHLALGAACVNRNGSGVSDNDCASGYCEGGVCVASPTPVTTAGSQAAGQSCTDDSNCQGGLFCAANLKCTAKLATGADCNKKSWCQSDKCDGTPKKCIAATTAPTTPQGKMSTSYPLPNMLQINDPAILIGRVIRFLIGLSGTIALISFIYGGVLWLISAGRKTYVENGKKAMFFAGLGLVITFASYIILNFVFGLFQQL